MSRHLNFRAARKCSKAFAWSIRHSDNSSPAVLVRTRQKTTIVFVAMLTACIMTGCVGSGVTKVSLRAEEIPGPSTQGSGKEILLSVDDKRSNQAFVGKATWTAFRSEIGQIAPERSVNGDVTMLVKQVLGKAGYQVSLGKDTLETKGRAKDKLRLQVDVTEMSYETWSWLWPYVPVKGTTTIYASLDKSDGTNVTQSFSAPTTASCWFGWCRSSIEAAISESLSTILNDLKQWVSTKT